MRRMTGATSSPIRRWPFDTYARIARLDPLPCAVIQSTHDNYLPGAQGAPTVRAGYAGATVLCGRREESSIFRRQGGVRCGLSRGDSLDRVAAGFDGRVTTCIRMVSRRSFSRRIPKGSHGSSTRQPSDLPRRLDDWMRAGRSTVSTQAQTREAIIIRGHAQSLRLYGTRGGAPVIVSSGDGGWIHLGPHVAEVLAAKGFFVVGFDVKAYLESFTSGTRHAAAAKTNRATTRCSPTSPRAGRRRSRF